MTSTSTVSHDGQRVYEGMTDEYDSLRDELDRIDEMREEIENNPNLSDSEKEAALAELDKAKEAVMSGLDYVTQGSKYDTTDGSTKNDADLGAIQASMARAEAATRHVETQLAAQAQNSPNVGHCPHSGGAGGAQGTSGSRGTQGSSGASGSQSAQGSSGAASGDPLPGTSHTVDELTTMMHNDPASAMEALNEIEDPKEKQMAFQLIQQRMQEINQMFSMMSNIMQAAHDTAKAAINNMRV